MDPKTVEEAYKAQRQLADQLEERVRVLRGEGPPLEKQADAARQRLERARASLDSAVKERDQAVEAAEVRLRRRKEEVTRLEKHVAEIERLGRPREAPAGAGDEPPAPTPPRRKGARGERG